MDAAGERLDQDSSLIGEGIRDRVQLARMGDQHLSPTAAGVRAIAGLQTDLDRALGDVVAKAGTSFRASRAWRLDAPHLAAEGRLDDDARAVVESADHLVAWHEGIARERVEVEGRVAADCGQVRAADAAQGGHHADPIAGRQLRLRYVAEVEHRQGARGDVGTAPRCLHDGERGD